MLFSSGFRHTFKSGIFKASSFTTKKAFSVCRQQTKTFQALVEFRQKLFFTSAIQSTTGIVSPILSVASKTTDNFRFELCANITPIN